MNYRFVIGQLGLLLVVLSLCAGAVAPAGPAISIPAGFVLCCKALWPSTPPGLTCVFVQPALHELPLLRRRRPEVGLVL